MGYMTDGNTEDTDGRYTPLSSERPKWQARVTAVVDQAHAENWGGKHREGFCEACADAHIVAQYAVPGGP